MKRKMKLPLRILLGILGALGLLACKSCDSIGRHPSLYGGPPDAYHTIESDSVK